jgi:hypothetical protein
MWSLTLREEHRLRVFENRVPRRRDEVTGGWRKLHNEGLRDLYSSPSIIRMIKSRKMRWAGHVAHMGMKTNAYMYRLCLEIQKVRDHYEDLDVGGLTILKYICRIWLRIGISEGPL